MSRAWSPDGKLCWTALVSSLSVIQQIPPRFVAPDARFPRVRYGLLLRSMAAAQANLCYRMICGRGQTMDKPVRHDHSESHLITRIGWLRAAVLGANDGIISTASLVMGVASAASSSHQALIAGVAGLAAGAMAMAAGEYVSVSSQADTEHADLTREARELDTDMVHDWRRSTSLAGSRPG